jgi:hypothetical protein
MFMQDFLWFQTCSIFLMLFTISKIVFSLFLYLFQVLQKCPCSPYSWPMKVFYPKTIGREGPWGTGNRCIFLIQACSSKFKHWSSHTFNCGNVSITRRWHLSYSDQPYTHEGFKVFIWPHRQRARTTGPRLHTRPPETRSPCQVQCLLQIRTFPKVNGNTT